MTEKEKEFKKEYLELLNKHNVSLNVISWSDDWGEHIEVCFKENGKYCNVNYCPNFNELNKGYRGLGG